MMQDLQARGVTMLATPSVRRSWNELAVSCDTYARVITAELPSNLDKMLGRRSASTQFG